MIILEAEDIEDFIENFIRTNLMVNSSFDISLGSIMVDLGLGKSEIGELLIAIEQEYGVDTIDLLSEDDTIPVLADKIYALT